MNERKSSWLKLFKKIGRSTSETSKMEANKSNFEKLCDEVKDSRVVVPRILTKNSDLAAPLAKRSDSSLQSCFKNMSSSIDMKSTINRTRSNHANERMNKKLSNCEVSITNNKKMRSTHDKPRTDTKLPIQQGPCSTMEKSKDAVLEIGRGNSKYTKLCMDEETSIVATSVIKGGLSTWTTPSKGEQNSRWQNVFSDKKKSMEA